MWTSSPGTAPPDPGSAPTTTAGWSEDITDATGIPATTSTLAYMEAFRTFGTERIGLFTPYTGDVNEQIMASYQRDGIKTLDHRFLGLSDNESFARVADDEMRPGSLELAAARPDAIIYLCTNLYGANITAEIEAGDRRSRAGLGGRHAVALPQDGGRSAAGPALGQAPGRN